jgi:hypothetical protein
LIVDELTREFFLAKYACKKLEGEKLEFQKSSESLKTSHIALEVQLDNLKNNATTTYNDALSNSKASTSNGCSRCYKIDINACTTNIAEMNAMKKEIARLSNSLIDEKKKESKGGEFENHTKGFGSSYMKKPQPKAKSNPIKSSKKPKPHASLDSFYVDYVLTWNHKGKVVAKYVKPRTKGKLIKRNVWVPKVLVTNTLGPKPTWVPKT